MLLKQEPQVCRVFGKISLVLHVAIILCVIVLATAETDTYEYYEVMVDDPFPCDNNIYCYGDILHTVQRSQLFRDSKTFVDMKLKYDPHVVQSNYRFMIDTHGPKPAKEQVEIFVQHNFDPPGYEFEPWVPSDWTEKPEFLSSIKDEQLQKFGSELNSFWKVLGRQIKKDVCARRNFYSMICVNNPLIVPGGRFIEFYYWDQFWILKGLLHSQMATTVRGMLENFLQMVEEIGYIPNGGRIYYKRSHPPLLIPMFQDFLNHTGNISFVENHIKTLDKEFHFWMSERTYELRIKGKNHTVVRYNVELGNPRPEAYNPDYDLVSSLRTQREQKDLYMHLKTAAESGLDFSSRWFVPDNQSSVGELQDTKARYVIPVDLNVLIYRNAKIMSSFHRQFKNDSMADYYDGLTKQWKETIEAVFWNETEGSWFDYVDAPLFKGHKSEFYPGNILPLIMNETETTAKVERVLDYLEREGVLKYDGGIPSSLHQTGEQWDFPNAWAPHVHWFIESLEATGHPKALQIAKDQAYNWIRNNYLTYKSHNNTMFEKYDVQNVGSSGGGGEYEVVIGFGWSNGVVMDLLNKYGAVLVAPEWKPKGASGGVNVVGSWSLLIAGLCLTYLLDKCSSNCC